MGLHEHFFVCRLLVVASLVANPVRSALIGRNIDATEAERDNVVDFGR
jgi:hypothetical protein